MPVGFHIAVVDEMAGTVMLAQGTAGVFDRAPELFCSRGDFSRIGENAVSIAAIKAIQLLDGVQIGQMVAIHDDKAGSFHARNAIGAKTDLLIEADP